MAALKKALAVAEDKAAKERATREKHEAQVGEAQQQLQGAIERFESLERDCKAQESKLAKARQRAQDARAKAQNALQEIQAAKEIAAGKSFTVPSKCIKKRSLYLSKLGFSRGVYESAVQHIRCYRVLSSRRGDVYGEAILVSIFWTRTSGAL